jgi:lipopolysaccharide/colanic/teichoic acid biosynthesis glycosyltransferase
MKAQAVLKRALDLFGALTLLVFASPVIAVSATLIRVVSPGPPIFAQWRQGRDGEPFRMFKIRTMRADAEEVLNSLLLSDSVMRREWHRYGRLADDPRLIPHIGRLLRRWSLDELPQLLNVVRGEMALVGPRPLPIDLIEGLPANQILLRSKMRPGLTGLWQVSGRSDLDLAESLVLDAAYGKHWSLRLDLAILLRTPLAVLSKRGAY